MAFQQTFMKNVDLILGDISTGTNFKCQLTSVKLTPDTNIVRAKTLCPEGQFAEVEDPEWTLELGYLDGIDPVTAQKALGAYLLANKGTKVPFAFRPKSGGPGYSGTVTLLAGAIGGDQGSFATNTVSLPLDGQPAALAAVTP